MGDSITAAANWLEIPAQRVIEWIVMNLKRGLIGVMKWASFAALTEYIFCFARKMAEDLSSPSLVIYMELSNEIAPTCRRSEL